MTDLKCICTWPTGKKRIKPRDPVAESEREARRARQVIRSEGGTGVVRIFVSSPLDDTQDERDALRALVAPVLKRLCEERGLLFHLVDLRWGITEEQEEYGEVLLRCLEEIGRCDYFIGILRHSYGLDPSAPPEWEEVRRRNIEVAWEHLKPQPSWLPLVQDRSICELQIIAGALEEPERAKNRSLFCFWESESDRKEEGTDLGSEFGPMPPEQLGRLKHSIRKAGLPVLPYSDPRGMAVSVGEALLEMIARDRPLPPFADAHQMYAAVRGRAYVRRSEIVSESKEECLFEQLNAYAASDSTEVLVVQGPEGSGKTALLASWTTSWAHPNAHPEDRMLAHFPEASQEAATREKLDRRLDDLRRCTSSSSAQPQRTVLVIDAVDRLAGWELLPEASPRVRVIVACSSPTPHLSNAVRLLDMPHLSGPWIRAIVERTLARQGREIAEDLMQKLEQSSACRNPLFLATTLEELEATAVRCTVEDELRRCLSCSCPAQLFERRVRRLVAWHERELGDALSKLADAGPGALIEKDLEHLKGKGLAAEAALRDLLAPAGDDTVRFRHECIAAAARCCIRYPRKCRLDNIKPKLTQLQLGTVKVAIVGSSLLARTAAVRALLGHKDLVLPPGITLREASPTQNLKRTESSADSAEIGAGTALLGHRLSFVLIMGGNGRGRLRRPSCDINGAYRVQKDLNLIFVLDGPLASPLLGVRGKFWERERAHCARVPKDIVLEPSELNSDNIELFKKSARSSRPPKGAVTFLLQMKHPGLYEFLFGGMSCKFDVRVRLRNEDTTVLEEGLMERVLEHIRLNSAVCKAPLLAWPCRQASLPEQVDTPPDSDLQGETVQTSESAKRKRADEEEEYGNEEAGEDDENEKNETGELIAESSSSDSLVGEELNDLTWAHATVVVLAIEWPSGAAANEDCSEILRRMALTPQRVIVAVVPQPGSPPVSWPTLLRSNKDQLWPSIAALLRAVGSGRHIALEHERDAEPLLRIVREAAEQAQPAARTHIDIDDALPHVQPAAEGPSAGTGVHVSAGAQQKPGSGASAGPSEAGSASIMIRRGKLKPPDRVVRLFLASAFQEMQAERDAIRVFTLPTLKGMCAKRGIAFVCLDLRWGITPTDCATGKFIRLYLREVLKCTHFVGLLKGCYGRQDVHEEEFGNFFEESLRQAEEEFPWVREWADRSLTELEIRAGVLGGGSLTPSRLEAMRDKSLFYEASPALTEEARLSACSEGRSEGPMAERRLEELKCEIANADLTLIEYESPEDLALDLRDKLQAMLEREYPLEKDRSWLENERAQHEAFAELRRRTYVRSAEEVSALTSYAKASGPEILVLHGESGCGKSALLASWAKEWAHTLPNDLTIVHFIGGSQSSSLLSSLARRINEEIRRHAHWPDTKPLDLRGSDIEVAERLRAFLVASASRWPFRVILVIDGLDQLCGDHTVLSSLPWLPSCGPNLRILVSTVPGPTLDAATASDQPHFSHEVAPLTEDLRRRVIQSVLDDQGRSLSPQHRSWIVRAEACRNPLFLTVVLDELLRRSTHESLEDDIKALLACGTEPRDLFRLVLERLASSFGADLVQDVASAIVCSRHGMEEGELKALLRVGESGGPPELHWTVFWADFQSLLVCRDGVYAFFHRCTAEAVERQYGLASDPVSANREAMHARLGEFFADQPASQRRAEEAPWALARGGADCSERLLNILGDADILARLDQYEMVGLWRESGRAGEAAARYAAFFRKGSKEAGPFAREPLDDDICMEVPLRAAEGIPLLQEALELCKKALGPEHPTVAATMQDLAGLLQAEGKYEAAQPLYEEALRVREKALGPEHPDVLRSSTCLGGVLASMGNFPPAVQLFEAAAAGLERTLGAEHEETSHVRAALGAASTLELLHVSSATRAL